MKLAASLVVACLALGCARESPKRVEVKSAGVSLEFTCPPQEEETTAGDLVLHRHTCLNEWARTAETLMWWDLPPGKVDSYDAAVPLERAARLFGRRFVPAGSQKNTDLVLGEWPGVQFTGPALEKYGARFVDGRFFYDVKAMRMRGVIVVEKSQELASARAATIKLIDVP